MKYFLEQLLYLGGVILVWGKIGSILLGLGIILYGCYRFNKALERIRLTRSYNTCQ